MTGGASNDPIIRQFVNELNDALVFIRSSLKFFSESEQWYRQFEANLAQIGNAAD